MRCQAELPAASVSMPLPRPPCHCCHALMIWEVDLRLETERWVCNRCPASGPARPLDLRPFLAASPVQSPTADPVSVAPAAPAVPATPSPPALAEAGAVTPPDLPAAFALVSDVPDGHNPGPAFMDHTRAGPPHVPLHQATYSCVYVPLLLDAAGMLHAEARAQWRAHPAFAPWWHGAVTALLARPFLSVRDVRAAVGHVLPRFDGFAVGRLQRFFDWSSGPAPEVTSLAALVRGVGRPQEGYYLPGPLQEVLLVLLLGEAEAAALQRLLDGLRAPESAAARPVADSEPGPDAPECSSPVDGACDPDRLGVAQATAAATATDSPTLREASPPDALDATTASRRTQRLDHAASLVPLPAPSVGPAEGELPTPQTVPRLQVVWGSQLPEASDQGPPIPVDTSDGEQPAAPPPNAHAEASDLHLANIAGLAAASEARARGRGRRGGRGRGRRAAAAEPALLPPAAPCPEPEGQEDNNLPSGTAPLRRVAAAEAGIRAGLASLDAVALEEVLRQRVLTLQGVPARLRGALRTAFRTAFGAHSGPTLAPAGAPRMEAVPPRAAHASVPCRQGVTHPAK